jgi:glycosyltransferase involved in cell wall biosynthesis
MCLRLLTGLGGIRGVELSAILMNEGMLAREIRKMNVPLEIVDETRLDFFRAVVRIRRILGKLRPDILHTHRLKENILGFLSTGTARRRIPLVCTQHGLDEPQSRLKWRMLSRVNRHVLNRHFRYVVAVSEDMCAALSGKYRLPSGKVVVIHNGTEARDRYTRERGNHPFIIGSAGRLFPVKDYPFFVEVAAEVNRHAREVRFELAGEGPEFGKISERIRKHGLQDAFRLEGFVENMADFYMGLDLYINTSLHEGFPMSVLEAMSHGLPVVAPTDGGIKEAVTDGAEGFLVEGRDPKRFAEKCLEMYRDPALRNRMAAASREKVEREFSIHAMTEKYLELYRASVS